MADLSEFFYNLIPGAIFIFAVFLLFPQIADSLPSNPIVITGLLTAISLFIGFVFQGFSKLVKEQKEINPKEIFESFKHLIQTQRLYEQIWKKVKEEKDLDGRYYFNKCKYHLGEKTVKVPRKKPLTDKELFFLVDNLIQSNGLNKLTEHFSKRASLWGNLYWLTWSILGLILANFIIFHFSLSQAVQKPDPDINYLLAIMCLILGPFSRYFFHAHLRNLYSTLLKTYIANIEHSQKK